MKRVLRKPHYAMLKQPKEERRHYAGALETDAMERRLRGSLLLLRGPRVLLSFSVRLCRLTLSAHLDSCTALAVSSQLV